MVRCIYLKDECAVKGLSDFSPVENGDAAALAGEYRDDGADAILVYDLSEDDDAHEKAIAVLRQICAVSYTCPVFCGGCIRRLEDVKKYLYAGAAKTVLDFSRNDNIAVLKEASERFGKERMIVSVSSPEQFKTEEDLIRAYAGSILVQDAAWKASVPEGMPVMLQIEEESSFDDAVKPETLSGLLGQGVEALAWGCIGGRKISALVLKEQCEDNGIETRLWKSSVAWENFKLGADGLIPVVVQDDATDEVLMVAYMNEEAFRLTLKTRRMTYYSRSRQEIWVKGLTSGHFQYVRSLDIDCDYDTLLARVIQIGAACHTGNRSCFFTSLAKSEERKKNPLLVLEDVYRVIMDRKEHPKEGSYTNYLFNKGIDKILKKVGEEAAEIIIAAKNPDKEEVKYELADFLYHAMVLMAEKGLTWEEVADELARRESPGMM